MPPLPPNPPSSAPTDPPASTRRVLLVDDEPALVRVGQKLLERSGYQVTAFESPIEALEAFRSSPDSYDVLLTDLRMPGLPGLELAESIQRVRGGFPVILMSGGGDTIAPELAARLGIRQVIQKPVPGEALARAIRTVLSGEQTS